MSTIKQEHHDIKEQVNKLRSKELDVDHKLEEVERKVKDYQVEQANGVAWL